MNDDLSTMIGETEVNQQSGPTDFEELMKEQAPAPVSEPEEAPAVEETNEPEGFDVNSIALSEWFEDNHKIFDNVNYVKSNIIGVDPTETLIFAVKDRNGEKDEEGNDRRHIETFKGANMHPVLDVPGLYMDVFGNGFVIGYGFDQGLFVKCYGVRTGLLVMYCARVDDMMIPFASHKMKKKDQGLNLTFPDIQTMTANLQAPLDSEGLQIQYRQVQKYMDNINTKTDAIKWLLAKASEVTDINHLLQIDNVIIWMIS